MDSVDAVSEDTVKVTFKHPVAAWFNPFTGLPGQILPEHILKDAVGAGAKDAPFNTKPIGTGPYRVTDFKPGDVVVYELNPSYHQAGKPFFDSVTLKGGGDAQSAARADITWEYNLDKARQLLDEVGAPPGPDGIRLLNGRRMAWLSTASTNSVRQKEQEITKASLQQIGIAMEIKAVDAGAYFSASNADSFQQLKCDLGMETNGALVYPLLWYLRYLSADPLKDIAQKENNWAGRNIMRYQNPEFNDLYAKASAEVDAARYTDLFKQMQDLVVKDVADIGLVARNNVAAASKRLTGYEPTPWAPDVWDIHNWRTV